MNQPRIVCICGSTRFREQIAAANRDLTLQGFIVLAPGVFGHSGDEMTEAQKVALDLLHLRKIDMADWVYVVAPITPGHPGGYVGSSTRNEIQYADATGKAVMFSTPQVTSGM